MKPEIDLAGEGFVTALRGAIRDRIANIVEEECECAKKRVEERTRKLIGEVCEEVVHQVKISRVAIPHDMTAQFIITLPAI